VTRIELRDPTLVVLVGAAGSGKSTFAARWFDPSEILSSDAFREILTGDASDQRATKTAFSIIHREVTKRLAAKRTVVVDATNIEPSARRHLIARAKFAEVPAIAIVFALPRGVVLARNAARQGRVVDPAIVERHLERLEAALPDLPDEGFDEVVVLRALTDVAATEIVRD
jgi:predicted kinase